MLFILDTVGPSNCHSIYFHNMLTSIKLGSSRLLVRHKVVMTRLQKEIDSVMGDSENPSREQIRKMPYLASVIRES